MAGTHRAGGVLDAGIVPKEQDLSDTIQAHPTLDGVSLNDPDMARKRFWHREEGDSKRLAHRSKPRRSLTGVTPGRGLR
jgi:hypothetical protein